MRRLVIQQCFLAATIAALFSLSAVAREMGSEPTADREQVERLLESVASGKELGDGTPAQVAILTSIVDDGERQESELAIRALGMMQSKATAAIPVLCRKLDAHRHSTRSFTVDALVAIGRNSAAPLHDLLHSSSGRVRAAATEILGRLRKIDLNDLNVLAKDPDPRVRAAAMDALSHCGQSGAARLVLYLRDPELAVAVEAARALKANREASSVAIPKLIDAITRPNLGWAAADALAAYGVEARRAVPAIIKNYPLGVAHRFDWDDAAEKALEHIGPPDSRDIPLLRECLTLKNEETLILTARSLALMGISGRSAADSLEAATRTTIDRYLKLQQTFGSELYDERDNSGRVFGAAEYLIAAVWHVTRDADRFIGLLTEAVQKAELSIRFSHPTPWQEFSAADCRSLDRMLRSSNASVQYTALDGISDIGANAQSLQQAILDLARGQDPDVARKAMGALAAIGPTAAEQTAPVLFSKLRDGTLPLQQFANAVEHLEIHGRQSRAILERGLRDHDRSTVHACARALCSASDEPDRIAALIIDAARKGRCTHRDAIGVLRRMTPVPRNMLSYLTGQMRSADLWTRHDAISALGDLGHPAASTIAALERQLDDKSIVIRLAAAKSIFQISGDASSLTAQLNAAFASQDRTDHYQAMKTIIQTGRAGAPFLHFVLAPRRAREPSFPKSVVDALKAIRSNEAVAELKTMAGSSDWAVRSRAAKALADLQDAGGKGGEWK